MGPSVAPTLASWTTFFLLNWHRCNFTQFHFNWMLLSCIHVSTVYMSTHKKSAHVSPIHTMYVLGIHVHVHCIYIYNVHAYTCTVLHVHIQYTTRWSHQFSQFCGGSAGIWSVVAGAARGARNSANHLHCHRLYWPQLHCTCTCIYTYM